LRLFRRRGHREIKAENEKARALEETRYPAATGSGFHKFLDSQDLYGLSDLGGKMSIRFMNSSILNGKAK
jgi:hypothetical protein